MASKLSDAMILALVLLLALWTPAAGMTLQPRPGVAPDPAPLLVPLPSFDNRGLMISGCATSYVVQSGDTLSGIAAACGVTAQALAAANGLQLTDTIYPGQRLVLPAASTSVSPAASSQTKVTCSNPYTVRRGDTLSKIAKLCNVSIANLKRWNSLKTDKIRVGQSLATRAKSLILMASPAGTPIPNGSPAPQIGTATPMPTPTTMIEPPIVK